MNGPDPRPEEHRTRDEAQTAIRLCRVGKSFADTSPALSDLSLQVPASQFLCVLGPSGGGKTTLLRLLAGLVAPDEGTVEVFGAPPAPGPQTGIVFQSFRLLPWRTVRQNIAFPLVLAGRPREEIEARVARLLDLVGLTRSADAWPAQLSGGMQQRTALARALAGEPRLLLMDEPFASVDAQTRELMQIELLQVWAAQRSTVVFVTHSIDEAILLGDRIILLGGRPGRVLEDIAVPIERPRDPIALRSSRDFAELSEHLRRRMRELVVSDPNSEFFGRL